MEGGNRENYCREGAWKSLAIGWARGKNAIKWIGEGRWQKRSKQLLWEITRREEGLGLVCEMVRKVL